MKWLKHARMFEMKSLRMVQGRGMAVRSGGILTSSRWAFALGVLAFGVTPRAGLAQTRVCIPPGDKARCSRDTECCEGAVCAGVCKRGCKINKVFYANGAINPLNDCQWCQGATNRFDWTDRVEDTPCGDQTDGECTNPNTCDGSGTCLDNHELATVTCGDDEGQCTNQDYCDGSGGCTDNGFKSALTSCTGASQGDECDDDPADHCTGTDGSCVDEFKAGGTFCGDEGTQCRNQDTCDGLGGDCVDNGFKPDSTICTGASQGDECDSDAADHCSGTSNTCVDMFKASGASCGDSGTQCRNQDTCGGLGGDCTDNGFKSGSTSCTGASQGDACDDDAADHCTGTSNSCVDMYKASGTSCGSNNDTDCDNPDTCNGSGGCQVNHLADGAGCTSDGNACTDDVCNSGVCTHPNEPTGTNCGSSSDTDCDNPDTCNGNGSCQVNNLADGTGCATDGIACTSDVCAGGVCTHPNAPANAHCTGTANGGPCDDDAKDHCDGTSGACVDAFKPSSHACHMDRTTTGDYACKEVSFCTGTSSTCPPVNLGTFYNDIPCRWSNHPICDPPEYCVSYGQCAPPQHVDATCDGGNRPGEWCDIYEETIGNRPCGNGGTCVKTVCRQGTGCEKPWTCAPSGQCISDGFLPAGTDCIGDLGCEKYSCDAVGNCVDQNVTRSPSASCRAPANECDQPDYCGSCDASGENCTSPYSDERARTDFTDYPNCGPDVKKPTRTACTYHPLGEDAPGLCIDGACNPYYCKNSIECPDGWVCGCPPSQVCPSPYCVPAPAEHGYGDECTGTGRCTAENQDLLGFGTLPCVSDQFCQGPKHCRNAANVWQGNETCVVGQTQCGVGSSCAFVPATASSFGCTCDSDADCDQSNGYSCVAPFPNAKCSSASCDANSNRPNLGCETDAICKANNHLDGKCITDTRGDCGSIPGRTLDYVCCAGMAGDGLGGMSAPGQTGRCQECCGYGGLPDQNCTDQDATDGSTSFQCCDGKCTDVVSDIHNCVSCNYDSSGYDCTDLISACSPGVVECDAINIGSGCVMTEYCAGTVQQEGWIAASCELPQVRFPVPACDFCVSPLTLGTPCMTDADCGVLDGAGPPPPGPFFICLPGADCRVLDGITSWCYHDPSLSCDWARHYAYTVAPECRGEAPFTGCVPVCQEIAEPANVGEECRDDRTCNDSGDVCETDADCPETGDYCIHECHGGTTCKTSCHISDDAIGWYLMPFCFENPTCQY